jgi:hypothetical protein
MIHQPRLKVELVLSIQSDNTDAKFVKDLLEKEIHHAIDSAIKNGLVVEGWKLNIITKPRGEV